MSRLATTALVLAALLAAPLPVAADPPPAPPTATDAHTRAAALLAEGSRLYADEADYPASLAQFRAAHALEPSWRALNGIALCQRALGRDVDALLAYQQLLADFGPSLGPEQRAVAESQRAGLTTRVARLDISAPQPGVRVTIDGRELGKTPLAAAELVMPGTHQVLATRPGHRPFAARVTVAAGQQRAVAIALAPDRPPVIVQLAAPTRPLRPWVPWATAGGGGLLMAAAGLLVLSARSDDDSFDAQVAAQAGDLPRPVGVDDSLAGRADDKRAAATLLGLAGGVALATGLSLAIVNRERPAPSRARLAVAPGGIGFALAF